MYLKNLHSRQNLITALILNKIQQFSIRGNIFNVLRNVTGTISESFKFIAGKREFILAAERLKWDLVKL
jgi:hypothetical protein